MQRLRKTADSSLLDVLPRDVNRQAVLKTLDRERGAVMSKALRGRIEHWTGVTLDPETVSGVVQSAIREGLIDIAGEGDDLKVKLTPFGAGIAKSIE